MGGGGVVPIIASMVFSQVASALTQSPKQPGPDTSAQEAQARAEAEAEEREAKARRAEDRRAEEAVLKNQAHKQQLSQSRQTEGLSASLGEGGSLAGQSVHASVSTQPQLKERLGQ